MAVFTELKIEDLHERSDDFDAVVDKALGIDHTCSSTDWVLPAYRTWAADLTPRIAESELGWIALCHGTSQTGVQFLGPPEPMWGFGCPLITNQPDAFAAELANHLLAQDDWESLFVPGLAPHGALREALIENFLPHTEVFGAAKMVRCRSTLAEDFDAYMGRFSSKRRRDLQRIMRRATEAGVKVVDGVADSADAAQLFDRIVAVELESWKGRDGSGMVEPDLQRFYRAMTDQLRFRTRVRFAQIDGRDVGYVLGHTRNQSYRGLQISYDQSFADLSLGSVLQLHEINDLIKNGITHYDLGMAMDYKQRWSTESFITTSLMISRP